MQEDGVGIERYSVCSSAAFWLRGFHAAQWYKPCRRTVIKRRVETCTKDYGSSLAGWEAKCLQNAIIRLAPTSSVRKRWRVQLPKNCDNDATRGAGLYEKNKAIKLTVASSTFHKNHVHPIRCAVSAGGLSVYMRFDIDSDARHACCVS